MEKGISKQYDLHDRTLKFAQSCRTLLKSVPKTVSNIEDGKQLVRSSGSVHANYIEATECLSKKDFYYRMRVCRKEVKESRSWLILVYVGEDKVLEKKRTNLVQEALELTKIFGSIVSKNV